MEHDGECEGEKICKALASYLRFSDEEAEAIFGEKAPGGIGCRCWERSKEMNQPSLTEVAQRTMEYTRLYRDQVREKKREKKARFEPMSKVGDRFLLQDGKLKQVDGQVIQVDFRNRRRVIE